MKPLFIFSLPRSGSTLLQRMLSVSDKISTASETWILLPFLYTLKSEGAISEYWHSLAFNAISDFYKGFPGQKSDYTEELKNFILRLYKKRMEPGTDYFLDKTPRYHLICREIMELFPEGKFIFLWRNPLAVVASIINTWTRGKWKLLYHRVDLYQGIANLVDCFQINAQDVCSVQYEKLVINPQDELRRICNYLDIPYEDHMIRSFAQVRLDGWMGDRLGIKKHTYLQPESIKQWSNTFDNIYRKRWAKRYLEWIGGHRLSTMGYDKAELLEVMNASGGQKVIAPFNDMFRTCITSATGILRQCLGPQKKMKIWLIYR